MQKGYRICHFNRLQNKNEKFRNFETQSQHSTRKLLFELQNEDELRNLHKKGISDNLK